MADENIVDEVVDTKVVAPVTDKPEASATADPAGATLIDSAKADAKPAVDKPAPVDWPTDWREKAAGGDAKKLSRLQRYASPQAIADALIAVQTKMSETRPILAKDAKPEEVAIYREAMGIPEAPEKYDLTGYEVPEAEKPLIDKFLKSAHAVNMTPEHVRASLEAYTEISEHARNERLAEDERVKTEAEDKLRNEWGQEYRVNLNLMENLLSTAPQGLRDKLMHGRLADGTPIGSSVEVLQFLVGLERERNPAGVVTPGSATTTAQTVADEKARIEKVMREDRTTYNRDQKMQDRYRQLIQWEIAQGQRAA